jgi:hypothetical protein
MNLVDDDGGTRKCREEDRTDGDHEYRHLLSNRSYNAGHKVAGKYLFCPLKQVPCE